MRIATPCTQNLDAMPRAAGGAGVHCTACDRDVLDLRRTPKKRALAVIASVRAEGDGKVCVRVRATPEGVPIFAKDPSPFARFALPAALAGSLAACAPAATLAAHETTPPVAVLPTSSTQNAVPSANVNGTTVVPTATVTPVSSPNPPVQPVMPPEVEMAGGLAFYDGP